MTRFLKGFEENGFWGKAVKVRGMPPDCFCRRCGPGDRRTQGCWRRRTDFPLSRSLRVARDPDRAFPQTLGQQAQHALRFQHSAIAGGEALVGDVGCGGPQRAKRAHRPVRVFNHLSRVRDQPETKVRGRDQSYAVAYGALESEWTNHQGRACGRVPPESGCASARNSLPCPVDSWSRLHRPCQTSLSSPVIY